MTAPTGIAADELRLRHYLQRLNARPFGHQEPHTMSDTTRRADWLDEILQTKAAEAAGQTPPARPRDWLDDILEADTAQDEPAEAAEADEEPRPTKTAKTSRKRSSEPRDETETTPETDSETDEEAPEEKGGGEGKALPAWDPLALTGRIVGAYQARPLTTRLQAGAQAVQAGADKAWNSRARYGRLVYTASATWAAWRLGFTPWLIDVTDDAPAVVLAVITGAGYGLDRGLGKAPVFISWPARSAYTATILMLIPHL